MNAIEGFLGFVEGIISWCFWENSFSFFGVISIKSRCPGVSWWGLERVYLIRSQRFVSSIGNMKHSIVSVCVPQPNLGQKKGRKSKNQKSNFFYQRDIVQLFCSDATILLKKLFFLLLKMLKKTPSKIDNNRPKFFFSAAKK